MKCVFGDWDCPVWDRLEEMQREMASAMKTSNATVGDEAFQEYMNKMIRALGSPLVVLTNFCQACPIVKHHYKEVGV